MGADYSSRLVVGVPVSAVMRRVVEATTQTRYDTMTGKAFQQEIRTEKVFLGSVEVTEKYDHNYEGELWELFEDYGLEGFATTSESEVKMIGAVIAECPAESDLFVGLTMKDIAERQAEVKEKLKALGVEHPVSLYLFQYVSC